MPAPARRRATYEDVLRAPPNMIAEVIYGVLHTQPRPAFRHLLASSRLGGLLGMPEVYRLADAVWQRVVVHHDAYELQLRLLWER